MSGWFHGLPSSFPAFVNFWDRKRPVRQRIASLTNNQGVRLIQATLGAPSRRRVDGKFFDAEHADGTPALPAMAPPLPQAAFPASLSVLIKIT
jgi:hypothetical protein